MITSIGSLLAPTFVAAITALSLTAHAQQPPTPPFEVVSIKRNVSGSLQRRLAALPGGRFTAVNVTTMQLIQWAYQLPPTRIVGATGWVTSEQFDVDAAPLAKFHHPASVRWCGGCWLIDSAS